MKLKWDFLPNFQTLCRARGYESAHCHCRLEIDALFLLLSFRCSSNEVKPRAGLGRWLILQWIRGKEKKEKRRVEFGDSKNAAAAAIWKCSKSRRWRVLVDWIGQILDMSVEQPPKDELEDFCQRQVDYGYNIKVSFLEFLFSRVLQHCERSELHLYLSKQKLIKNAKIFLKT